MVNIVRLWDKDWNLLYSSADDPDAVGSGTQRAIDEAIYRHTDDTCRRRPDTQEADHDA